jgi:hypothetical protein
MFWSLSLNAHQFKIGDYGEPLRDPHANYLRRVEGTIRLTSPGRLLGGFYVAIKDHREKASINVYTKPGEVVSNICIKPNSLFLPTRLLDLGKSKWPCNICLVDRFLPSLKPDLRTTTYFTTRNRDCSNVHLEVPEYVTLSHCWGCVDGQPLKLLKGNLAQFKSSIPQELFP